ncbi:DNA-deoxyinosine glycosylase [Proteiniclasticum sp.]|uniref:DNA-deoxyinosine glycosylase n=1 Tax=Proteiniclasticum sp. TaxID=2053595 RepID=UPI00289EC4FF|nr:DNA-deoxyinosine glycosylase [Proteiniclasticum sp.]
MKTNEIHPFGPIYDENSRVLILGSFPSVKSRNEKFFYAHPQNRFWKVMKAVTGYNGDISEIEGKTAMLLENHIALWDTIAACEIEGSSDLSIRNVKVNDLSVILSRADIKAVYCNGKTSYELYRKYLEKDTGISAATLPSTSPANASWTLEKLTGKWKEELSSYIMKSV